MLDSVSRQKQKKPLEPDHALADFILRTKGVSVLFSSRYGRTRRFTTSDSKLYLTQSELGRLRRGDRVEFVTGRLDCAISRQQKERKYVYSRRREDRLYEEIRERYSSWRNYLADALSGYTRGVSMVRMWNVSLVGSLIFGMFLMTMIYRYLGPGAQAKVDAEKEQAEIARMVEQQEDLKVLQTKLAQEKADQQAEAQKRKEQAIKQRQEQFEDKIRALVGDHPIKQMAPYMAKEADPLVVAFYLGIARQESSWGEHVPVHNGKDCYNYVGFRMKTKTLGSGGHSCFATPEEGYNATVKRIKDLIYNEKMTTAKKMVSPWKCGYRPDLDDKKSVQRWVDSVDSIVKEVLSWRIPGNK